jgi:acetoacetyl-CoA synthetase
VEDVGRFWALLWEQWDILADGDPSEALADRSMPGARWFPGSVAQPARERIMHSI